MIDATEFARRRAAVLRSLRASVGLVLAGDQPGDLSAPYRPHAHFEYLTGLVDEPGAALLLDPNHPVPARRVMLFLRPLNPELEKWDGLREPIGSALVKRTGIETIFRTAALPRFLLEAGRRGKRLACLHPLAPHTAPVSPDLELFRRVAERVPGTTIEDRSSLLAEMRAAKSAAEVAMIQHAIDITAAGFLAAMRAVRPGGGEFEVQTVLEHAYREHGARDSAFRAIVGSGLNSTVLHYHANDQPLRDGDVVCIDSGARWGGYAADVTRTVPVSGRFTPRQREVYEVVLAAQRAAIKAARAGATLNDLDAAGRKVIVDAGFGDAFIHGIGHHLGLETHDVSPEAPLAEGAVVTIEPGIYLPEERLGIRIEDDVLIGRRSATVLSSLIPKSVEEIEAIMSGAPRAGIDRGAGRRHGGEGGDDEAEGRRGVRAARSNGARRSPKSGSSQSVGRRRPSRR